LKIFGGFAAKMYFCRRMWLLLGDSSGVPAKQIKDKSQEIKHLSYD